MSAPPTTSPTAPPRRGLTAHLQVRAAPGVGGTRLTCSGGGFPVTARRTGRHRVHLVSTGAWPLGGDDVRLSIIVEPGARLELTAVSAMLALPGGDGAHAQISTDVMVERGATLLYDPGALIVASGARLDTSTTIAVEEHGRVALRELLVLGRHDEPSGKITTRLDVEIAGQVLLRESMALPEPRARVAVDRDAKAIGGVLGIALDPPAPRPERVEDDRDPHTRDSARAAVLSLPNQRGWRATALAARPSAIAAVVDNWWQHTQRRATPTSGNVGR